MSGEELCGESIDSQENLLERHACRHVWDIIFTWPQPGNADLVAEEIENLTFFLSMTK